MGLMKAELTHFLRRERYERNGEDVDHRNGSYDRRLTLRGIGPVKIKVLRDRNGEFRTQAIPGSKQYERELSQDLSVMFLAGISTRTLSMVSNRLIDGAFRIRKEGE